MLFDDIFTTPIDTLGIIPSILIFIEIFWLSIANCESFGFNNAQIKRSMNRIPRLLK